MARTVYLMRHGQTLFNSQGRVQGWCDSPLTDLGIDQALAAKAYFDDNQIHFDKAYSSTQERETDTAKLIAELPITQLKGLKEMNFGSFEAQPEFLLPKWRKGAVSFEDLLVPYGGEDIREVGQRVKQTILEITGQLSNQTLLMVSHGAAIWGLVQVENFAWPLEFGLPNCAICHLEVEGDKLSLKQLIDPVNQKIITI